MRYNRYGTGSRSSTPRSCSNWTTTIVAQVCYALNIVGAQHVAPLPDPLNTLYCANCFSRRKAITHAIDRLDIDRVFRVGFDFGAQVANMDIDRPVIACVG